jgi:AcrR family transcriptional regulator
VDHDPRATRTHAALTSALILLMQTRQLREISISELVEAAGIHRTTFYGHYPDLLAFAAAVGQDAVNQLVAASQAGPERIRQLLAHIQEHRPLYRLVFGPLDVGFRRALQQRAEAFVRDRVSDPLMATFLAGGLVSLLEDWASGTSIDMVGYAAAIAQPFELLARQDR